MVYFLRQLVVFIFYAENVKIHAARLPFKICIISKVSKENYSIFCFSLIPLLFIESKIK